ncbi:MAG: hypothetical protein HC879_06600 [Leptolyngbyaceae cyanobacterium SL_5_9]|nr:hypothetical protein [Leptolyngbyaceae cyanobacterium SL_5_9]NJO72501.1 hypothetical protein [Leptolyngbyaceae cyanobacterium RM1_406_9]
MFIHRFVPAIAGLSVLLSTVPVQAQTYQYDAPPPRVINESGNEPERLAADNQAVVYGTWDFNYSATPDGNLFVTRIFASDFGQGSAAASIQIDCGRGFFRHVVTPLFYANGSSSGTPMNDVAVNQWLVMDRQTSFGQAMMRSCEAAAAEEGTTWQWFN